MVREDTLCLECEGFRHGHSHRCLCFCTTIRMLPINHQTLSAADAATFACLRSCSRSHPVLCAQASYPRIMASALAIPDIAPAPLCLKDLAIPHAALRSYDLDIHKGAIKVPRRLLFRL